MYTVDKAVLWATFIIFITIMLLIDFYIQGKNKERQIIIKEAVTWSFIWIILTLLFVIGLWVYFKHTTSLTVANHKAMDFLTSYLLEKALAIDNVFVWLMLFNYFLIPVNLQRQILIYGVLGTILLRTMIIFTGSWLISRFQWIFYFFGILLLFTGIKMVFFKEHHQSINTNPLVKWLAFRLRMTNTLHGKYFFIRQNDAVVATPLLMVLILVEISDIIFALDSIPVIFSVTTDPFILLTSNLFAILGLRAMYLILSGIATRVPMLKYGLSIILIFSSIKMLLKDILHIQPMMSLSIVVGILTLTICMNHFMNRNKKNLALFNKSVKK
ncbi:MAG: TerC/Alx family metal homeostasis membrane protein [Candidatus Arsenophonus melophagi]|nr:TerC/Alx family metal homeostasis membrane protein [Candidatus Arsenophonus melophagi]